MKLPLLLISALFVAAAVVVAAPVDHEDAADDSDNLVDVAPEEAKLAQAKPEVDVTDLIEDMARLHESASDVIQQVEETLSTLESLMPHSIRKRQVSTTVGGSVNRGPGGATGSVNVNHRRGPTTYTGSVSHGPGGTNWGAGVSHTRGGTNWGANVNRGRGGTTWGGSYSQTRGNSNWGANVNRGRGGTSWGANYNRSWNNGRTTLGGNIGRGAGGGTSGGITFRHRF